MGVFSILQSNRKFYHICTVTIVIHKSRNLIGTVGIATFGLPWVPEPRNLDERKLVRGKERRKKGGSGQMITQRRFGADQRDYESIRSPFAQ